MRSWADTMTGCPLFSSFLPSPPSHTLLCSERGADARNRFNSAVKQKTLWLVLARFFFYKVGDFKSLEQGVRLNKKENNQKRAHGLRGRWEEADRELRPSKNKQEVQLFHPAILSWALKLPDTMIKEGIRGKSSRLWLETSDAKLLPQ